MQVRLTRDYTPPPEWGQFPYRAGLIVTGPVAAMALHDGAGTLIAPVLDTKIVAPPEIKAEARDEAAPQPRRPGRPRKVEAA